MIQVKHSALLEQPYINWKHIDGPLLSWCGMLHWLTVRERFLLFIGLTDANKIANARFFRDAAIDAARGKA